VTLFPRRSYIFFDEWFWGPAEIRLMNHMLKLFLIIISMYSNMMKLYNSGIFFDDWYSKYLKKRRKVETNILKRYLVELEENGKVFLFFCWF